MFYLFLLILSFVEFYFFRLLNQIVFHGVSFSGDILFALFGIVISILFLEGMIHIKHLNKEWLKKLSFIIAIVAILYFFASCLSFNFNYIMSSLEISVILIVASFFLYRYQTAPEGEPDSDSSEIEEESEGFQEYFEPNEYNNDDFYSFEDYEPFVEPYVDERLSKLNSLMDSILENNQSEEMVDELSKTKNLVENVFNANSEYREENLENLIFIFSLYNEELESQKNFNIIEQINNSLNFINTNLENIYYNTRGAQVFKAEQEVKNLQERLEQLKN